MKTLLALTLWAALLCGSCSLARGGILVAELNKHGSSLLVVEYDDQGNVTKADVQVDKGHNYGSCGTDPDADGWVDSFDLRYRVNMHAQTGWVYPCSTYDYDLTDPLTFTDLKDHQAWFEARPGDANLDWSFDSQDLVEVFQWGHYEQPVSFANWKSGDWNLDRKFDSADLVAAFQAGYYETESVSLVPEPSAVVLLVIGILTMLAERGRDGNTD